MDNLNKADTLTPFLQTIFGGKLFQNPYIFRFIRSFLHKIQEIIHKQTFICYFVTKSIHSYPHCPTFCVLHKKKKRGLFTPRFLLYMHMNKPLFITTLNQNT